VVVDATAVPAAPSNGEPLWGSSSPEGLGFGRGVSPTVSTDFGHCYMNTKPFDMAVDNDKVNTPITQNFVRGKLPCTPLGSVLIPIIPTATPLTTPTNSASLPTAHTMPSMALSFESSFDQALPVALAHTPDWF
jgi:hypothetical protein